MLNIKFDPQEEDTLIDLLHANGVYYIVGDNSTTNEDSNCTDPVQLVQRLAACSSPLIKNASISLFILHPELAPAVVEAFQRSTGNIAENIAVATLATLYLQHWWVFRLAFALGRLPSFPEQPFVSLWEKRHLPPPRAGHGLSGLLALQEYQQQRYKAPLNFLNDWENQINHLLLQEEAYHRKLPDDVREVLKHRQQSLKKEQQP